MLTEEAEDRIRAIISEAVIAARNEPPPPVKAKQIKSRSTDLCLQGIPEDLFVRLEIEKLKGRSKKEIVIEALVLYFSKDPAASEITQE